VIECRECGLQLSDRARFCRACGTPVTGEQPATGGPKPDPDGGYWAAVGRAGADREVRPPVATAVAPSPPAIPAVAPRPTAPPPRSSRRPGLVVAAVVGGLAVLAAAAFAGYQLTREDPVAEPSGTTQPRSVGDGERLLPAATASCTASKSRDSTGNVTTYEPELVNDGDGATAWRCDGDGLGERLVLQFPDAVHLTSVGLVPGIVKVDPGDGTDRFEQNNKIAGVRWTFDDDEVEQAFEPTRDLQRTSVDVTTRTVTIEILRVVPGHEVENEDGVAQPATGKSPISEVELRGEAAR
jgi:zinc ribbon protein